MRAARTLDGAPAAGQLGAEGRGLGGGGTEKPTRLGKVSAKVKTGFVLMEVSGKVPFTLLCLVEVVVFSLSNSLLRDSGGPDALKAQEQPLEMGS